MTEFPRTDLNTVRRRPQRGVYDAETVYAIIDAARVCHVGIVEDDGHPVVIPQLHVRVGDTLYLHGSPGSRLLTYLAAGKRVCMTMTILDGLVLARSAFHHSMNYRSVVAFGCGRTVEDSEEKMGAFEALVEKVMPGRWADTRRPEAKELNATSVVAIPLDVASAKVRTGPPVDDERDLGLPFWAGVVPIEEHCSAPIAAPDLGENIPLPPYLASITS